MNVNDELSWDVRDGVAYDYAVGVTISRLLDQGRWDDEGIILRYAALRLMDPYLNRLDAQNRSEAL